jgi:hypothetical protein
MLPLGLTSGQGGFLAAAMFVAAFIRGYSGFGFSAIFIILAALVTNPLPLIPVMFTCEIAMTALQARGIRQHIDWRRVVPLLIGAGLATVPAVAIMAKLGEREARLAISAMILGLSLLLLSGWKMRRAVGVRGNIGVGVVSGIVNSAGVGGLPAAAFLTAQPIAPAMFRATMIMYLTGIDLMALPVMAGHGLVSADTVTAIALAFPVLAAGVWAGSRGFALVSQDHFRRAVVVLLTALSILNIAKAI